MKQVDLSRIDQDMLAKQLDRLREADREYREARGGNLTVPAFSTCSDDTLLYIALEGMIQERKDAAKRLQRLREEGRNVESGHLHTDGQHGPENF